MATATEPATTSSFAAILERLGGIDPGRVRVLGGLAAATEDDLIRENERGLTISELVDGLLVEKGMGFTESAFAMFFGGLLNAFVIPRNLGVVSGEAGMMRLHPGMIRVPDVAFTSWDRFPGRTYMKTPVAGFAPDLAIEVLSQSNTKAEMARKRADYFAAGVRLVWEVDLEARTVAVYDSPQGATILDATMTLDGGAVLPGFALPLDGLFADLDRQGG